MMRNRLLLITVAAVLGSVRPTPAAEFYPYPDPENSVTVIYPGPSSAFWPESNLIQGPGVGFTEEEPHDKIGGGEAANWVTTADAGFPADFIEAVGMPVIQLDLGQDVFLAEISTWGYEDGNTNGTREFQLRFATETEGLGGFGTSISFNPTFIVEEFDTFAASQRRSFRFTEQVTARYVELTVTDNYFDPPGDGTGANGWGPGGDRVGMGEIAFEIIPDFVGGDFNGDGVADLADFGIMASNFNTGDRLFSDGDFNFDGRIDLDDFIGFRRLLSEAGGAATAVPEPLATGLALGALLCGLVLRRKVALSN